MEITVSVVEHLYQSGFKRGVHTVIRETNTTFNHKRRNALKGYLAYCRSYLFITHGTAGAANRDINNKQYIIASATVREIQNKQTRVLTPWIHHCGCTVERVRYRSCWLKR